MLAIVLFRIVHVRLFRVRVGGLRFCCALRYASWKDFSFRAVVVLGKVGGGGRGDGLEMDMLVVANLAN